MLNNKNLASVCHVASEKDPAGLAEVLRLRSPFPFEVRQIEFWSRAVEDEFGLPAKFSSVCSTCERTGADDLLCDLIEGQTEIFQ